MPLHSNLGNKSKTPYSQNKQANKQKRWISCSKMLGAKDCWAYLINGYKTAGGFRLCMLEGSLEDEISKDRSEFLGKDGSVIDRG